MTARFHDPRGNPAAPRRRRLWTVAAVLLTTAALAQTPEQPQDASGVNRESEVERLRTLLLRYRAEEQQANTVSDETEAEAAPQITDEALAERLRAPFGPDKVLLPGDDAPLLLAEIDTRLADSRVPERRHDTAIIATVQNRARGSLLSSTTRSLMHLGRYQFAGVVELRGGSNRVTAVEQQWQIDLPEDYPASDHLLTLFAPPATGWQLHALPTEALSAAPAPLPAWLTELLTPARAS